MASPFGSPFDIQLRSRDTVIIAEPTLGLDASKSAPNLALGATPDSDNFIMRDGALEPRPMLRSLGSLPQPMMSRVLGGTEVIDTGGLRYPLVSGQTQLAWWQDQVGWSTSSYVSAAGYDNAPNGALSHWDWAQIYADWADENVAIGASGSLQPLYCWRPGDTTFSTLTGAPGAKTVAAIDNYLLAGNVRDTDGAFVQRVRWSDRGSASSWTGGLSGYEDLLAAKGAITRIMPLESGVVVFFDNEIWAGALNEFPFTFRFSPLDNTLGCPYPWTAATTPDGILFLGRDYQLYLLPKIGGPAQPIGQRLHYALRTTIQYPEQAFGVYDQANGLYELHYSVGSAGHLPQRAAYLHLANGAWAPQSFDRANGGISLTWGFLATINLSTGSTWAQLQASGVTWGAFAATGETWNDLSHSTLAQRTVVLGSSAGTLYTTDSDVTSDAGTAAQCYWETRALGGFAPGEQKSVSEVRLDYIAASASSATVRTSPSQGAGFSAGVGLAIPAASTTSQVVAYLREASRYPVVRVEVQGFRPRIQRMYIAARTGGR